MRRRIFAIFLLLVLGLESSAMAMDRPEAVVAVGRAVGIEVECPGLLVVGFSQDSPARDSGIRKGDLIRAVDGQMVSQAGELREMLQNKSQVTLTATRKGREQSFLVALGDNGGVKVLGANVRTEMAGIGTITYYDPATEVFGALGHGITDGTELFPVESGFLCKATIVGVDRGRSGAPGMLQGAFDSGALLGQVTKNTPCGIFGDLYGAPEGTLYPVASRDEVVTGPAEILCNVQGDQVERYSVEIRRIYPMEDGTGRNMMLKVTDQALIQRTGGIVQGMSGSPIVQNGKIVGAVTHVLVSDPQVGYGIFIDNMLEAA